MPPRMDLLLRFRQTCSRTNPRRGSPCGARAPSPASASTKQRASLGSRGCGCRTRTRASGVSWPTGHRWRVHPRPLAPRPLALRCTLTPPAARWASRCRCGEDGGGRSPHVCLSCVDVQRFAALLAVQLTWGACVGIRTTVTGRNQWHHVGFALVGGTVSDGAAMLFADGGTRDAYLRCVCERFTVVAHCRCKLCVLACALSKPSFVCICYHFIALAREPALATVEHYS